jgi:hypothetical protein
LTFFDKFSIKTSILVFVNMFNVVGALFFILLYYIEVYFHIPLVLALLNYLTPVLENQASIVFLLFNLTSAIFFIIINTPLTAWPARKSPPLEEERLAPPQYLLDFQPGDPESGLALIRLEQTRELEQIVAMLSTAREEYVGTDLSSRYLAFTNLSQEVAEATASLAVMQMHHLTAKDHACYQTRQAILSQVAESVSNAVTTIRNARSNKALERLSAKNITTMVCNGQVALAKDDQRSRYFRSALALAICHPFHQHLKDSGLESPLHELA